MEPSVGRDQDQPSAEISTHGVMVGAASIREQMLRRAVQTLITCWLDDDIPTRAHYEKDELETIQDEARRHTMRVAPAEVPVYVELEEDTVAVRFAHGPTSENCAIERPVLANARKDLSSKEEQARFSDIVVEDRQNRINLMHDVYEFLLEDELREYCPSGLFVNEDGLTVYRRDEFIRAIDRLMKGEEKALKALSDELGTPTRIDLALFGLDAKNPLR